MHLENVPANSFVPPTSACISNEQWYRYSKGDKYYYSNSQNPHPFTKGILERQEVS